MNTLLQLYNKLDYITMELKTRVMYPADYRRSIIKKHTYELIILDRTGVRNA